MGVNGTVNQKLLGFLLAGTIGIGPVLFSLWGILVYRNVSLTIHNGKVILQGIFQRQEITLSEIEEASWDISSELILVSQSENAVINLEYYNAQDELWLIHFFRNELPDASQKRWDRFCLRVAIPLQERLQRPESKLCAPGPGEALITRRRYDLIGIPVNLLITFVGVYSSWKHDQFGSLIFPVFSIGLWLLLRYSVPSQGVVQERLWSQEEFRVLTYLLLTWGIAGMIGFIILLMSNLSEFVKGIGSFCLFILCFTLLLETYNRLTTHYREERNRINQKAIEEWEAGNTSSD